MIIKVTYEQWKEQTFRALQLREARKIARKGKRKVTIKVGGLIKATIDGRYC